MPKFTFTSPDGKNYDVEGPEGATKEQAFGILQQKIGKGGDAPAPAAPPPAPDSKIPERPGTALMEGGLNMATGMIAKPLSDIAGLAATGKEMISPTPGGGDPAAFKRDVQEGMTYEPKTAGGAAVAQYNPMALIGKLLGWGGEKAGQMVAPPGSGPVRTAIGHGVEEAVPQAAGLALSKAGGRAAEKLPEKQAALDVKKGENVVQDTTRAKAQDSGYITPPERGIKAAAAGLAGKTKVEKMISEKNAENATRRLGEEVGVPKGAALSQEEIATQKRAAGADYDKMAAAAGPKLAPTPAFKGALQDALKKIDDEIAFNKEASKPLVPARRLLKSFVDQTEFPTPSTMRAIQRQRKLAKDDFRKGDSDMGTARMAVANQLENLVQENLAKSGNAGLVDAFKAAREKFAKLYFLDRVVNESTGKVDLAKVAALSDSPAYKGVLTGAFKEAADFSKAYRKAAQKPTGEAAPRLTVFDGMFAMGALASGHPGALGAAAGEIGGRLAVPAMAERGMLQNRAPSYEPSAMQRALPNILRALGLGAQMRPGQLPPPPEQRQPQ